MSFLTQTVSMAVVAWLVVGTGRSAPPQDSQDHSGQLLQEPEVPERRVWTLDVRGDKVLLEDKGFSDPQEQDNSLADDRTGRSRPEPFSMVVPVARNFSSLQELFDILRADQGKPQRGLGSARNLTYVKGTESKDFVVVLTN